MILPVGEISITYVIISFSVPESLFGAGTIIKTVFNVDLRMHRVSAAVKFSYFSKKSVDALTEMV